ncbi:MAG: type I-E CRISPR-associated protein Cse2/CasB [bacterium]
MSATQDFINLLPNLKEGQRSLLRQVAFAPLDQSLLGFDIFTGLWWPLRYQTPRAPRREASWLILKLYGFRPMPYKPGNTLGTLLSRCYLKDPKNRPKADQIMYEIIESPLEGLELPLRNAFVEISNLDHKDQAIDWVALTDDLSSWEDREVRNRWITEFLRERR